MDKHVEEALVLRERMAVEAVHKRASHPENDPQLSKAFAAALRKAQIVVWEEPAVQAWTEFWADEEHNRKLIDIVYTAVGDVNRVRVLKEFCRDCFHYFPSRAFECYEEFRPKDAVHSMPVVTQVMAHLYYPYAGKTNFCCAQQPQYTDVNATADGIRHIAKRLKRTANTEFTKEFAQSEDPLIVKARQAVLAAARATQLVDYHYPIGDESEVDDFVTVGWFVTAYKMLIFLEQPWVGTEDRKIRAFKGAKVGTFKKDDRVKVVYLRKRAESLLPKIVLPDHMKGTGKPLEFEVDVRGHWRTCASGKTVWVREHKKGPLGVVRTRVIKAVR